MTWREYQATLQRADVDPHQRREAMRRVTFICFVVVAIGGLVAMVMQ